MRHRACLASASGAPQASYWHRRTLHARAVRAGRARLIEGVAVQAQPAARAGQQVRDAAQHGAAARPPLLATPRSLVHRWHSGGVLQERCRTAVLAPASPRTASPAGGVRCTPYELGSPQCDTQGACSTPITTQHYNAQTDPTPQELTCAITEACGRSSFLAPLRAAARQQAPCTAFRARAQAAVKARARPARPHSPSNRGSGGSAVGPGRAEACTCKHSTWPRRLSSRQVWERCERRAAFANVNVQYVRELPPRS